MNIAESPSLVSEAHYKIVEERRRKHLLSETKGKNWEAVRSAIKKK